MVPDPATFRVLPWSPHSGWLLCDLYHKDGAPIPISSRAILRKAIERLAATGRRLVCGLEVEFHVYRLADPKLAHTDGGMPASPPETSLLSHGYQLLTDARYDALEEVMDDLRRACQRVGRRHLAGIGARYPSRLCGGECAADGRQASGQIARHPRVVGVGDVTGQISPLQLLGRVRDIFQRQQEAGSGKTVQNGHQGRTQGRRRNDGAP